MTREEIIRLCRDVCGGPNRPPYCEDSLRFDPHEWVIEAVGKAFERGVARGAADAVRTDEGAT
jgi:hypothetical protein